jgi:hypothetical protein
MYPDRVDEETAKFALDAVIRSHEDASAAVKQVQDRASALLTLILALVPVVIAVTLLLVPTSDGRTWARWIALALFLASDMTLIGGAVMAFLASGLIVSGGSNPARFTDRDRLSLAELQLAEADAWYLATEIAFISARRKVSDLFLARRLVILALFFAVIATPFVYVTRSTLAPVPSPTPTPTIGAAATQ